MIDLKTQLSYFKNFERLLSKKLDAEAKSLLSRAVYLINIGSNDYIVPFTRNSSIFQSYSQKQYVDMVIGNLTFVIKVIKINNVFITNSFYILIIYSPLDLLTFFFGLLLIPVTTYWFARKYIRKEEENLGF